MFTACHLCFSFFMSEGLFWGTGSSSPIGLHGVWTWLSGFKFLVVGLPANREGTYISPTAELPAIYKIQMMLYRYPFMQIVFCCSILLHICSSPIAYLICLHCKNLYMQIIFLQISINQWELLSLYLFWLKRNSIYGLEEGKKSLVITAVKRNYKQLPMWKCSIAGQECEWDMHCVSRVMVVIKTISIMYVRRNRLWYMPTMHE